MKRTKGIALTSLVLGLAAPLCFTASKAEAAINQNTVIEVNENSKFAVNGNIYYAEKDGSLRTGLVHDGDYIYAYDEDGKLIKNQFYESESGLVRTDEYGRVFVGEFNLGEDEYYADKDGIIQTGVVLIEYEMSDGTPYTLAKYYREDGRRLKEDDPDTAYLIVEQDGYKYAVQRTNGWVRLNGWIYQEKKEGSEWVAAGMYYADEEGHLLTGFQEIGGNLYYLQEDGLRTEGQGFHEINGKTYYMTIVDTLERSGWFQYNGKEYYANEDATIHTAGGWFEVGGKKFYLEEGGAKKKGLQTIGGKKYYFDSENECAMLTEAWAKVRVEYGDGYAKYQTTYFDKDGVLKTGWFEMDGELYYFTEDGLAYNGEAEIDGYTYMFEEDKGRVAIRGGWYSTYNGDNENLKRSFTYYFDEKGHRASGLTKIGDDYYILSKKGQNINRDKWYTMDDGTVYRLDKDGKALRGGWFAVEGSSTCYFNEDGTLVYGLTTIDGDTYYFELEMLSNQLSVKKTTGFKDIDGKRYYFNNDGKMVTGSKKIDGSDYLFGKDGAMPTGWQEIGGAKYYYDKATGKKATGEVKIDGKTYKFGSDGKLVGEVQPTTPEKPVTPATKKGWVKTGSSWYYYKNNKALTGWQTISKKKYYFDSKGILQTGWKKLSGKWYYFSKASKNLGEMLTGWQKLDKKWYFFSKVAKTKGQMVLGWQKIKKKWYYFSKSSKSLGVMTTGWNKIDKKWYFFSKVAKTRGEMVTGWKKIEKKWHYFGKDGVMVAGKSKKIGNKTYKFDKNGVCLNK